MVHSQKDELLAFELHALLGCIQSGGSEQRVATFLGWHSTEGAEK
tara:strand:+ start:4264 stop:4398 length:135 start_codon:yes stop_codon:yes gene_type:complete